MNWNRRKALPEWEKRRIRNRHEKYLRKENMTAEKQEIQVMQFERSDVLRQRRLAKQLLKKDLYDEIMFRRVMTVIGTMIAVALGFLAGEITVISMIR